MKDWDNIPTPKYMSKYAPVRHFGYKADFAARVLRHIMSEEKTSVPFKHEIRISKLPYCGLIDALERIERPNSETGFDLRFYTSIGTAVHENLQGAFARSKKYGKNVVGNWKCNTCGYIIKSIGPRPFNGVCPKCESIDSLEYEELDFSYKGLISGHMDGLTKHTAKGSKKVKYAAWEYKTSGEDNILNPEKRLPYPKHIVQIETYCALLWLQYKIFPSVFYLVYINRNKVQGRFERREQFVVYGFKVKKKNLIKRIAHLDNVVVSNSTIKKLLNLPTEDRIRQLESLRPCKSRKDYDSFMTHHFFGDDECPFLDGETCFMQRNKLTEPGMKLKSLLFKGSNFNAKDMTDGKRRKHS